MPVNHKPNLLLAGMLCLASFVLFVISVKAQENKNPPTVQDCLGAIPVCQPIYTTHMSYTGHGNVYPEIHDNSVCPLCMDGEKNDVFYILTVQTDGLLRFTLTPNNPSNDYDWSVFNMTNADCSQLYPEAQSLQVSCNSYGIVIGANGPTGINTALGNYDDCNGPGSNNGPPFNKDLDVFAGETYLINISNWSSTNQEGYTLDFSASTASIFDDVPPVIDSIQEEIPCSGTDSLYFRFSENVLCDDVFEHEEKFSLTGPNGSITITDVSSSDCATGATQSPVFYLKLGEVVNAGSYTLSIVGDIRDLCYNVALYDSYTFELAGINAPIADAGNDTTVANGAIITLHGSATSGTAPLEFHWEPASLLVDPNVPEPTTISMGASTEFVLTVTDNLGCYDQDPVMVTVLGGPLGVATSATPDVICTGEQTQLNAIGTGGSGAYTFSWSSNPAGFTSTIPNPVVLPATTTTYTVEVQDGFSTINGSVTVEVHPLPVANAGIDQIVPYGTTTTLNGSASGGSGTYAWLWDSNPAGFSSTQQQPITPNLEQTTIFNLRATDQATGCMSLPDDVLVTVSGSPLAVAPVALPPVICAGTTTQLMPMTGGGSGSYTYSWTSVPEGFTSSQAEPVVTPLETTTYYVTVTDGYNQAFGEVNVVVNPVPHIYLGPPDTSVCIYDSIALDAGNQGASYYWSNGATSQTIMTGACGIGYEVQTYRVQVMNEFACIDSAEITIIFSFAACTGYQETIGDVEVSLFPNPTDDLFTLEVTGANQTLEVSVASVWGQNLFREVFSTGPAGRFSKEFEVIDFPAGLYLITIKMEGGTVVRKLMIEK
jgi:hypothetical protein